MGGERSVRSGGASAHLVIGPPEEPELLVHEQGIVDHQVGQVEVELHIRAGVDQPVAGMDGQQTGILQVDLCTRMRDP